MPFPLLMAAKTLIPGGGFFSAIIAIIRHWKEILIAILLALTLYQNTSDLEFLKWVGLRTIPGIEQEWFSEVAILTEQNTECENSRQDLTKTIAATNSEIEKWIAISKDQKNKYAKLTGILSGMKKKSDENVNEILHEIPPSTCSMAMKYLKNAPSEALKWR